MAFLALVLAAGGADAIADGARAAAALIDGKRIKKGTVASRQVKNGSLKPADLSPATRALLGRLGPTGPAGPAGQPGAVGPPGPVGEAAGDVSGPYANLQLGPGVVGAFELGVDAITSAAVGDDELTGEDIDEPSLRGETQTYDLDDADTEIVFDLPTLGSIEVECTGTATQNGLRFTAGRPAGSPAPNTLFTGAVEDFDNRDIQGFSLGSPASIEMLLPNSAVANRARYYRAVLARQNDRVEVTIDALTRPAGASGCDVVVRVMR